VKRVGVGVNQMPKIDIAKVSVRSGAGYPARFLPEHRERHKQALGDAVGLTQFGVNLTRIAPGAASALRHYHEQEDEFVFIVEGELVLIDDAGEVVLKAGDCAGFKANDGNAHRLVNRSAADAVYLEVGTRAARERVHYPDVDLHLQRDDKSARWLHKSGEPYV
jgi:uncharacterized cupin superfamily protein